MSPTLTERSPRAALPETVTRTPPVWRGATVLRQRWTELAFFHWRYEPHVVQRLLPDGIAVDTFDRDAWVGLIPFVESFTSSVFKAIHRGSISAP